MPAGSAAWSAVMELPADGGAERVGAGEAAQPAPTAANRRRAGDAVGGVGAPDVLEPAQGVDVAPGIGRGSGDEVHDGAPHRQRRAGAQHVVAHGVQAVAAVQGVGARAASPGTPPRRSR